MLDIKNEIIKPTSFKDLGCLPRKSLCERPDHYPMRFTVPDKFISWEKEFTQYAPTEALTTSSSAKKAQEVSLRNGINKSFEGEFKFDEETQIPRNIVGRTGIKGGGNLYNFGPNHAADTLLFSGPETNGQYKALLIKRKDGAWAMLGGFVDPQEDSRDAAIRELGEEALELSTKSRNGKSLFIDFSILKKGDPKKVLLYISGTHGVEGFSGSAIEIDLMQRGIKVPDDSSIIFCHALNPFGME